MNIFELYLDKIKSILVDLENKVNYLFQKHLMELMQKYRQLNLIVIFQPMLQWYFQN